jgi:hypothetical protein
VWTIDPLRTETARFSTRHIQPYPGKDYAILAWLTIALGETDPGLVREAVLGYLGGTPVSIERRELVAGDALDWIRRGLALNRVAVFVALLQLGDVTINERLAGLRGRLNEAEAAAVWCAFADSDGTPSGDFIAEWRACA